MMSQKIKSKKFITIFLILLFLIVGAFLFWQKLNKTPDSVSAAGEGWIIQENYRKPITISNVGSGYTVVSFTTVGTTSWTVPAGVSSVEILIVGGGGGGGGQNTYGGGGGGGGGLLYGTLSVSGTYTVVVGAGGAGGSTHNGYNGGNSSFGSYIAYGGGGGGTSDFGNGQNGGSAGGASSGGAPTKYSGDATQTTQSPLTGYGNAAADCPSNCVMGGGGAGGPGYTSGTAGAGKSYSISGAAVTYAQGGTGYNLGGAAGAANTGNGGGGVNTTGTGGAGGSGIVILKYLNPAVTLTNYQVKLTVPYVAGMRADFGDLKFTSSDGSTQLSYWIESYAASTSAVVWVKIPSLPAGDTTIYMYYGNPWTTTTGNGANTFDFFDDFAGTAIDTTKWTIVDSTGFSVSGGQLHGTNTNGRITSIATFNSGVVLEIKEYRTGTLAPNGHGVGGFWLSDSNGIGWLDHPGNWYYRKNATWVAQGAQAPADVWRKTTIAVPNSTQVILSSINWSTGATIWNPGTIANAVSAEPISLGPRPGESASYPNQTYSAYWDWILVRKYTAVEPTFTIGTEEVAVGAVCGSSSGSTFESIPTVNLCTTGTASAVVGSGPWTWTCTGSWASAFCSANPTVSGSSTISGSYTIEKFVGVGSTTWTVPSGVTSAEVLVVAGGGGGGMDMGGGGGGGGVIHNTSYALTAGAKTLTVGAGGIGAPAAWTNGQPGGHQFTIPATNGGNSVFGTLTAIGGGFGGSSYRAYTPGIAGGNGGSGGGAGGYNNNAGTFYGGTGTAGQGNRGGNSTAAYYSGGGGGAGAAGVDSTAQANGGAGYSCSILGTAYYWGGGGGGAGHTICGGVGGSGGGGGGARCSSAGGSGINAGSAGGSTTNTPGGNAGAFTGGGGGGSSHYNYNNRGGNGGSGIVVIKYLTQQLNGWPYRKQITVNNTSGAVLNSYPIKFTVSYVSGKMKSDFSDLRFTRLDGITVLPHWIESYTASTSAVVWVKVDSIPVAGNQIFMYYGNSLATSTSSFDNTNVFSTTGLIEWLKVDSLTEISDGESVATVTDSSGNSNNFTQATASRQPIYKTNILNGKPVLRLTAASQQTMTVATNFAAPTTVIYVSRMSGTTKGRILAGFANNWLLGYHGGLKTRAYFQGWVNTAGTAADANWYIYSATIGGTGVDSSFYENGSNIISNQGGVTGPNGLSLSGYLAASEFSDADIAEVLVYNSTLSISSRSIVERYLANKYALSYTPYYTDPTVTFGSEEFSGPVLAQVTAVPSSTTNPATYTFSSTKAGTITYSGDCSSYTTSATVGNNTITFNPLSSGTHSNCKIMVTDSLGIQSALLSVNSFTITYDTECASMATGGIISRSGSYCIHTFISNGTFDPISEMIVGVLVVAGGGGGGGDNGGGGGGGGVVYNSSYTVSDSGTSVTVGSGGSGSLSNSDSGTSGSNSVFGTITAIGGGRGASGQAGVSLALTGGSGGGGDGERPTAGATGTSGQGNTGGTGLSGGAGGGGGAGAVGSNGTGPSAAGAGGAGLANNISGASIYYGGGGGGGNDNLQFGGGAGGIGGGGAGNTGYGFSGVNNSGGGGGGAGWNGYTATGGNGGSGVVVVRYQLTGGLGTSSANPGTDCNQIYVYNTNSHVSGLYWIKPDSTLPAFQAYCDMVNDGGGWTLVLQNNYNISTPSPTWTNAINSNTISGLLDSTLTDFDILVGLSYWNKLGTQLRAQVGSSPSLISHKATYTFSLNTANNYSLSMSNQSIITGGTAPALYTYSAVNGYQFSTYDADHDVYGSNCSTMYNNHPWWYGSCWEGNFFAGGGYQEAPYWTGVTSDYYAYGSIWIKNSNPASSFMPTWKEISPF